jgi:hypothetical protein
MASVPKARAKPRCHFEPDLAFDYPRLPPRVESVGFGIDRAEALLTRAVAAAIASLGPALLDPAGAASMYLRRSDVSWVHQIGPVKPSATSLGKRSL